MPVSIPYRAGARNRLRFQLLGSFRVGSTRDAVFRTHLFWLWCCGKAAAPQPERNIWRCRVPAPKRELALRQATHSAYRSLTISEDAPAILDPSRTAHTTRRNIKCREIAGAFR